MTNPKLAPEPKPRTIYDGDRGPTPARIYGTAAGGTDDANPKDPRPIKVVKSAQVVEAARIAEATAAWNRVGKEQRNE